MSNSEHSHGACNCCDATGTVTPAPRENPAGLPALAYRVGTHGSFKATMLSRIAAQRKLGALTTRDDDDPTIALIDAWATVLDVLGFYQERIVNEGYLRTATERRSVLELARSIGYELRPGVAAGTHLAFTVEEAPGSPPSVTIAPGTKTQTVPGQDELPQTFETIEEIDARIVWNALPARSTRFVPPQNGQRTLYLNGIATNLKPGDALLIIGGEPKDLKASDWWDFRRVTTVDPDADADFTIVALDKPLSLNSSFTKSTVKSAQVYALRQRAAIFGHNASDWTALPDAMKASYLGLSGPDQLEPKDKLEWPAFQIFAPSYPAQFSPIKTEEREIQPTAASVAAAASAAAHGRSAEAASMAAHSASQVAANAVESAQAAVATAEAAAASVSNVARHAATAVEKIANKSIQDGISASTALADSITAALQEVLRNASALVTPPADVANLTLAQVLQRIAKQIDQLAPNQQLHEVLKKVVTETQSVASTAMAVATVDISETVSSAVTTAAPRLAELRSAIESFAQRAREAVVATATAMGSGSTASIVAASVHAALEAVPPPMMSKLEFVAETARSAAEIGVLINKYGPAAAQVATALASPVGLLIAPAIGVASAALGDDAVRGAEDVQRFVREAVNRALEPTKQMLPRGRAFPELSKDTIDLDTTYPQVTAHDWLVLSVPNLQELFKITHVTEGARAQFLLTGKTTRVTLKGENLEKFQDAVRATAVFTQGEKLDLAEQPITQLVAGDRVELAKPTTGLIPGQWLAVTGLNVELNEVTSEVVALKGAEPTDRQSTLTFAKALKGSYLPATVTINANVARATHGETKFEVLGSGDGSRAFQRFQLKQRPLTHVSAKLPSGSKSTLEVRVNGLLWDEVPTLYQVPPDQRVYCTRLADDGTVTVQFGDGVTGARLPTGGENIVASYRIGTGLAGLCDAGQISQLMTRPLGAKAVTNPEPPTGAADPESRDQARQNAPMIVLTLDRIVSLRDFEDFSRGFAGVGKVQAKVIWAKDQQIVHLTVAAADGGQVASTSQLYQNLTDGINAARHTNQLIQLDSYLSLRFNVTARIRVDPRRITADVLAAVKTALRDKFSFANRSFGQTVTQSELIACAQSVPGVIAVDLESLHLEHKPPAPNSTIPAHTAHWNPDLEVVVPAELLTINPDGIVLIEMKP